jgi:hypothetical protein
MKFHESPSVQSNRRSMLTAATSSLFAVHSGFTDDPAKVCLIKHHAMKLCGEWIGGVALRILSLGSA